MSDPGGPVVVPIPEPIGRRARLGPFPSGTEAAKFASYAGVGAVVAGATEPLLWLPFLGVGFVASVVRWDGKGFDAHLADYGRFRWRARSRGGPTLAGRTREVVGAVAPGPGDRPVAVLETGGVPVAFLPQEEARALFEAYRALLRAQDSGLFLSAENLPIAAGPFLPGDGSVASGEAAARDGYRTMLRLLARHRRRRVVRLVVPADRSGPGALPRLEERVEALTGHLLALGLSPVRLRDRELGAAIRAVGGGRA